jgi:aminoglycoside phosphotransferase (APT) family kinase protein
MAMIGERLAQGRTAQIHEWGGAHVLKLFRAGYALASVEYEQRKARAAMACGARMPAVCGIVEVNGRFGLIYERVRGATMLECLRRQPWRLAALATQLAALHAEVHRHPAATPPAELPAFHEIMRDRIAQIGDAAAWRERALRLVDESPHGAALCHGDFHPDNVMFTENGTVVIDWNDAYAGHPLSDVARTLLLLRTGTLANEKSITRSVLLGSRRLFSAVYLRHYCRITGLGGGALRKFGFVAAVARMREVHGAERAALTVEIARMAG